MRWRHIGVIVIFRHPQRQRQRLVPRSRGIITNETLFEQLTNTYGSCVCYYSSSPKLHGTLSNKIARGITHAKALKNGSVQDTHVGNYILSLYAKGQAFGNALKLFDEFPARDVKSWTVLISGFAKTGLHRMGLDFFVKMRKEGVVPNEFTCSSVLKCCSGLNGLRIGKAIHGWIIRNGIGLDVALENSILDLYVKCGDFDYAKTVFELMGDKDFVSWNIMIGVYMEIGDSEKALDSFRKMPVKEVSSWNTIIDGFMRNGLKEIALDFLYEMVIMGPNFDRVTFSTALVLVSSLMLVELGRQIHGRVLRVGFNEEGFVKTSLVDMYRKFGQMEKASNILRNLPQPIMRRQHGDITYDDSVTECVSWSSIIAGYAQNGMVEDALRTFSCMVRECVEINIWTLTSILSACATAGILELGLQIHVHIVKVGLQPDVFLYSSMIDMYSKCGRLEDASLIFNEANFQNVVLCTSMIFCYALHGQGREAIRLFQSMQNEGITPNEVSFVGILSACCHAGLLEEGCKYFTQMKEVYRIKPGLEHFIAMVDLLGRAGRFDEIKHFIRVNNISHLSGVWKAFLSSCRLHKNTEMAMWVSMKLAELEPFEAESYVLLSNTCAGNSKWDEVAKLRVMMQERKVKKRPGQSWIQVKNKVEVFVMGGGSHPEEAAIYACLDKLNGRLYETGC